MRSPFPGMDPYLERHWLDVHGSLIHLAKAALQPQLGEELVARSDERVIVEDPVGLSRAIRPDVRVVETGSHGQPISPLTGSAVAEPLVFDVEAEPVRQRYIEILDLTTGGRVVTVIEFLSPTNKLPGDGREKYRQKQRECRDGGVNLVEIDLTRTGAREMLVHRWSEARRHESTFQVSVWRSDRPSRCELYTMPLQNPLPAIRVPLRPADRDVVLDIQALVQAVYSDSRYDLTIDYRLPSAPPLEGSDEDWADGLLRAAGKR